MAFQPGISGNPAGTPGPKAAKLFKDALTVAIKRTDGDKTELARIAEALVEKAKAGDVAAINAVADRLDGKPTQLIGGDEEAAPIVARLVREIFDPKDSQNPNGEGIPAAS